MPSLKLTMLEKPKILTAVRNLTTVAAIIIKTLRSNNKK